MNINVYNKEQAKQTFLTLFHSMSEDTVYNLTFDELKSFKTKKQLGFIFGGIIKSLCHFFNGYGYHFTPEQIKEWLYSEVGVRETLFLPKGQPKEIIKTLSGMSKKETSDFICRLLQFIDESEALTDFVLPVDLRYCWVNHIDEDIFSKLERAKFPQFDEQYLNYQRKQHCIRCGRVGHQVHHIKRGSGLGKKNPDWFTVPICADCHNYLHHSAGEQEFLKDLLYLKIDIELLCRVSYFMWKYSY